MMTKLAHMRANKKNHKGFSLVELIIVIAIMVALIAVMGPAYVKYIQKSRDSAIATAAEDLQAWVKTAIADEDTNLNVAGTTGDGTINVAVNADGELTVTVTNINLGSTAADAAALAAAGAGFTPGAKMGKTDVSYTIKVERGTNTVTMTKDAATT